MTAKGFRVLHISPFKQSISGSDESLVELVSRLGAFGIESVVALPKESPYTGRYTEAGASIVHLPLKSVRRTSRPDWWAGFTVGVLTGFIGVKSVLNSQGVDIVHTNMETVPVGAMAARLAGLPSVIHVRSTSIGHPRWVFRGLVSFLRKYADRAVAISDAVYKLLIEGGFPQDRLERIYDPVDIEKYRPRSADEISRLFHEKLGSLGIPPGSRLVGLIGRMNPIKGQEVFLDAAAKLAPGHKDTHFVLVGDAADGRERRFEEGLRRKARYLGIGNRTHFLGHRSDVRDLLPLFTTSVSPSTTEAFGRPAAEAMACEVPAVVAATDGLKEIVKDGETGWVVPPQDPGALALAIERVLSDPRRAAEMGRRGRERVVEKFSSGIHADKMRSLFESLL